MDRQNRESSQSRDRRRNIRFPLEMELRYRVAARAGQWVDGRSVNISSSGLLLRTEEAPVPGSKVQLAVCWPQLLDDRVPLRLVVQGRVVRSGEGQAAVRFDRFEFRTAKEGMPASAAEMAVGRV
jgi:hypothetical protein